MNEQRTDALIRRLDVASEPGPEFVEASFRVLSGVARSELQSERMPLGRLYRRFGWPISPSVSVRGLALAVALAMLLLAFAWASLSLVGRRSAPAPWTADHLLFGREDRAVGAYAVVVIGQDGSGERVFLAAPHEVSRVSHDGRRIATGTVEGSRVFPTLLDADGSDAVTLRPDPTLNLGAMAWSHDGDWLAFEGWDDANGDRDGIYLMRSDGTGLQRLTGKGVPGDFSADDRSLVFVRPEGLFIVGVDGTAERQIGTLQPDDAAGFMPDGHSVYTAAGGSIWIVNIATGRATEVAIQDGRATSVRLSPDGSRFAITYDPTIGTTTGIATIGVDGSDFRQVVDVPDLGEVWPDWLP